MTSAKDGARAEVGDRGPARAPGTTTKTRPKRRLKGATKAPATSNPLVESLTRFHAQGDVYVGKIEEQVRQRQELKETYFAVKRDEAVLRRQLHQVRDGGSAMKRLQTRVHQLEHRAYVASMKRSNLRADYNKLKDQVDHGRREVLALDERLRDLETDVDAKRETVTQIVAASRAAFARRNEAMDGIRKLERRHQDAAAEFEREWDALSKVMAAKEERYRKEFSKLRLGVPSQSREVETKILKKVQRDENKLKLAVVTGNWATARTRIAPHVYNEKVHTFEEAFGKVQKLTGAANLKDLAEIMAASEDKNYRAFQHLAATNTEVSSLEATVALLTAQLEESKHQTGAYSAFKRRVIRDLRDDCDKIGSEADGLEAAAEELSEKFEAFKPHLRDIFKQAQCDSLPLPETFDVDTLSDGEMLQCLGMIEQRVNEILHVFTCVASVAREKAKSLDSYQTFYSVADESALSQGPTVRDAASTADDGVSAASGTAPVRADAAVPINAHIIVPSMVGPSRPKVDKALRIVPPKVDDHDVQEVDPNDPFRDPIDTHRPWHRDDPVSSPVHMLYRS